MLAGDKEILFADFFHRQAVERCKDCVYILAVLLQRNVQQLNDFRKAETLHCNAGRFALRHCFLHLFHKCFIINQVCDGLRDLQNDFQRFIGAKFRKNPH